MSSTLTSLSQENRLFPPSPALARQAAVPSMAAYQALYDAGQDQPEHCWEERAINLLSWKKPFTQVLDESHAPHYRWFAAGYLNASYNCLDRHVEAGNGSRTAIIFEGDDGLAREYSYEVLLRHVCRFANALKRRGVQKGDRVMVYLPMGVECVIAMQACARIGAIHSVVFAGFSAKSLHERMQDTGAVAIVTCDEQVRGGKTIPLKPAVEEAFTNRITLLNGLNAEDAEKLSKRLGCYTRVRKQQHGTPTHDRAELIPLEEVLRRGAGEQDRWAVFEIVGATESKRPVIARLVPSELVIRKPEPAEVSPHAGRSSESLHPLWKEAAELTQGPSPCIPADSGTEEFGGF